MSAEVRFQTRKANLILHGYSKPIRFEKGFYATSDPDEIAFIKAHRWFGNRINVASPEDEPKPEPMERVFDNKSDDQTELIELPCGVEGCSYVARADTMAKAIRNRNAHWTRAKHKPEGA